MKQVWCLSKVKWWSQILFWLLNILKTLESVRDVSLRAGQALVTNFAETALDVMLPTLLDGLFDDNWRIRQVSLTSF